MLDNTGQGEDFEYSGKHYKIHSDGSQYDILVETFEDNAPVEQFKGDVIDVEVKETIDETEPNTDKESKFCANCGREVALETVFCPQCGYKFGEDKAEPQTKFCQSCGEKINIDKYGILHNRCIDGDLITRLAWDDKKLMDFMGIKIEDINGTLFLPEEAITLPGGHFFISKHKKDQGQRPFCECMASKDIGEYNTCPHLCEYCYANTTKQLAIENWKRHQQNKFSDTITGK